jgi:hypothetical protein
MNQVMVFFRPEISRCKMVQAHFQRLFMLTTLRWLLLPWHWQTTQALWVAHRNNETGNRLKPPVAVRRFVHKLYEVCENTSS